MTTDSFDALIVGGVSAGLSAALMLARSRRRIAIIDSGEPRNAVTAHMHGVLGRDGWSPLDLLATGRDEVARYGATFAAGRAATLSQTSGHDDTDPGVRFVATLESGDSLAARHVLVATGLRDDLPNISGLRERWGAGVAHCPYCDGWEARDGRIVVLATGPSSVHQAQLLRQLTPTVTYAVNGSELPDEARAGLIARGIAVDTRPVVGVDAHGDAAHSLRLADGAVIAADTVFVRPAAIPHDGLLRAFGAATAPGMDGADWVTVDAFGRTSVPGLWAAGNVVNPAATVPVAAAAGATAGAAINAELVEHEIAAAIRATVD